MSRINNRFIGEYEQAAADMIYQFVEVAAGEVGTADAALKQYIAGEHAMVCRAIVHQTARRVSRYVDCFQFSVSESDDVTVVKVTSQWYGRLL